MSYDTVVFDNDGVLVGRTNFDVLREATRETFEKFEVTDPDTDHVEDMTIGATPRSVRNVCAAYDIDPDAFMRTRDRTLSEAQKQEALAGRKSPYSDLSALSDLEVSMGVVSSNQQATVDFLLEHYGVDHLFGAAYGREPTLRGLIRRKPNSHYVDRALADLDADTALYVGDNESDVEAAHNAGIDSAFIRRPHRRDWDLEVWPTWDIDSLEDLHRICG